MNKIFLLAPLTLACAVAHAQSGLYISGTVDAAVQHVRGSGDSRTGLASGGNATSKLIIRGTEDLGDGLQAGFWLESGFYADEGTFAPINVKNQPHATGSAGGGLSFDRKAIVSLKNAWGTLQGGRDWSPTYETFTGKFDPFALSLGIGLNYAGSNNPNGIRVSNSIAYVSPQLAKSLSFKLQHWFGEGSADSYGSGSGVRLNYAMGPMMVEASFASTNLPDGSALYRNVGANYNFGSTTVSFSLNHDQQALIKTEGWLLGLKQQIGTNELRASYSATENDSVNNPKGSKIAVGYVHNLSKRTALYGTAAYLKNRNGGNFTAVGYKTLANRSMTGLEVGLRHNF